MSQDPEVIVPDHMPPVALAELGADQQRKVEKIAGHVRGNGEAVADPARELPLVRHALRRELLRALAK